jgi:hypothetical protein
MQLRVCPDDFLRNSALDCFHGDGVSIIFIHHEEIIIAPSGNMPSKISINFAHINYCCECLIFFYAAHACWVSAGLGSMHLLAVQAMLSDKISIDFLTDIFQDIILLPLLVCIIVYTCVENEIIGNADDLMAPIRLISCLCIHSSILHLIVHTGLQWGD